MKIYVATPMYGGNCTGVYTNSLIQLIDALRASGHDVIYDFVMNESLITRARNLVVHNFLKTDYDALLFIDADQGFYAKEILKLVNSGKKFIGAISPMKNINWSSAINSYKYGETELEKYSGFFNVNFVNVEQTLDLNDVAEVENIGTGLLFVHREVFEELAETCDSYYAHGDNGVFQTDAPKIKEFFKTEVVDGVLLSEDFTFCKMWKDLGNKVYVAPWVRLSHTGPYTFAGSFPESAMLNQAINDYQAELEKAETSASNPE